MAVALFVLAAATSHSHPTAHPHWFSCREPERIHCIAHEMPLHHRAPVGFWQSCKKRCVVFPYFHRHVKPVMHSMYRQATRAVRRVVHGAFYSVTGYSWGCGTPNGITANNIVPHVGIVANDWLPFGTRIYVPSLGYSGVVEDRGQGHGGFDLFEANCSLTYKDTGYREVIIG